MKAVLCPTRETIVLPKGSKPPTERERLARIAHGRKRMVARLLREFPKVTILGIVDNSSVLVEIPDEPAGLLQSIKRTLCCESGPAR